MVRRAACWGACGAAGRVGVGSHSSVFGFFFLTATAALSSSIASERSLHLPLSSSSWHSSKSVSCISISASVLKSSYRLPASIDSATHFWAALPWVGPNFWAARVTLLRRERSAGIRLL
jgi:hypothetical protein